MHRHAENHTNQVQIALLTSITLASVIVFALTAAEYYRRTEGDVLSEKIHRLRVLGKRIKTSVKAKAQQAVAAENFRQGINAAMTAAHLAQVARTEEQWHLVSYQWQQAIERMQAIPNSDPQWALAQAKLAEYRQNLFYAEARVKLSAPNPATGQPDVPFAVLGISEAQSKSTQKTPSTTKQTLSNDAGLVISQQSSPLPGNWLRLATSSNNQVFYVDSATVRRNYPTIEFWQRVYQFREGEAMLLSEQRLKANCSTNQWMPASQPGTSNPTSPNDSPNLNSTAQSSVLAAICGVPGQKF